MKRKGLLITLAIAAVVGVLWLLASGRVDSTTLTSALGLKPASDKRSASTSKPICSQVIVPAGTDCIPQHLANLPPDPGPAGMATIEGIDSDHDGVRDDVQRFIVEKWGHSERAVRSLNEIAKGVQKTMLIGDSVSREEARKLTIELINQRLACYRLSVDKSITNSDAAIRVVAAVTNTPQRYARRDKFDALLANMVFEWPEAPISELCGYDPASLPN